MWCVFGIWMQADDWVSFEINVSFARLKELMASSGTNLNSMVALPQSVS